MSAATELFGRQQALIGMVHVRALPGTPHAWHSVDELVDIAVSEARVLEQAGFDALIVENMHDRPYVHGTHGPETVAIMTRIGLAVREAAPSLPLGVQVLSGGNLEALAVAVACGGRFIRCENFVFSHVADEGLLERAEAGPLLRERRRLGAAPGFSDEPVAILTDIKKKHASHALTADVPIDEAARAAEFFGSDGLIVSGVSTGREVDAEELASVRRATPLPVLVGSGVTKKNAAALLADADALIVGSSIKRDGRWSEPVEAARCEAIVNAVRREFP